MSCRSVKLLDECEEDDGGVTRDSWWQEIRQEVRGHARCLGCNVIVGYTEDTAISDDCVVLCASGTAASAELSQVRRVIIGQSYRIRLRYAISLESKDYIVLKCHFRVQSLNSNFIFRSDARPRVKRGHLRTAVPPPESPVTVAIGLFESPRDTAGSSTPDQRRRRGLQLPSRALR